MTSPSGNTSFSPLAASTTTLPWHINLQSIDIQYGNESSNVSCPEVDEYLQDDVFAEPYISANLQAVQRNDAGNWLESLQEITNLNEEPKQQKD